VAKTATKNSNKKRRLPAPAKGGAKTGVFSSQQAR
jgi:hypothetical protein